MADPTSNGYPDELEAGAKDRDGSTLQHVMDYGRRDFIGKGGILLGSAALLPSKRIFAASKSDGAADDLCFLPAVDLVALLQSGRLSARAVMEAHLAQIARINPQVNAVVAKLDDQACLALADDADRRRARGDAVGPLHGVPFAVKDTEDLVGFPNTHGSPIFRHHMPKADSGVVERLRNAGALFIGKTNVPEFAMGSQSYNQVYGTTLNPYDLTKCAGGSSGGAAVALATGLVPLANGSDLAGSLRNPANFNNVVGFRPSMGLVPLTPTSLPFGNMVAKGPLARNVRDVAFLLSILAGEDPRDPGTFPSDPAIFVRPLNRDLRGLRVAWCPDLGGLPMDPRVRAVLDSQRAIFERLGCRVVDAIPDLSGADESFLTLRAWNSWTGLADLLKAHRDEIKPEAIGEIEAGSRVTSAQLARAMKGQAQVITRMRQFQENHDIVACAVNQVPPFPATQHWPTEIAGAKMHHYIEWMKSAYLITVTGCPAISVPAGFTADGLPVGIQLVGRTRQDFALLQVAYAFEQVTRVGERRPPIATGAPVA